MIWYLLIGWMIGLFIGFVIGVLANKANTDDKGITGTDEWQIVMKGIEKCLAVGEAVMITAVIEKRTNGIVQQNWQMN